MGPVVLVVDDDPATRALLQAILESAGYECELAGDADHARAIMAQRRIDLMLCDITLPGESGLELVERLARSEDRPPVLLISNHDDPTLAERGFELGAYGYLIKSFRESEILINVRGALRRYAVESEALVQRERLERAVRESASALSRTRNQLEHSHDLVRRSREETVLRLARAAEYRDPETPGHVERMSRYAELMAGSFGLHAPSMLAASAMHDIGKLAVPDDVLLKPTPLTPSERALMETHCEVGHRILRGSGSGLLDLAATIAWTHHERMDGHGYPRALRAEEIPLEGRIAAVADVFDALTSDRVYRPAYELDQALDIMRAERGAHFDAQILDCLLSALPEVAEIQAQCALDLQVRTVDLAPEVTTGAS